MLKIISANVNGIRSAYKKGFYEYIAASGADIVCVQELKAQEADLSDEMKNPHGMHGHWHCAEKRGYSGVAVYSKRAPDNVQIGMGSAIKRGLRKKCCEWVATWRLIM